MTSIPVDTILPLARLSPSSATTTLARFLLNLGCSLPRRLKVFGLSYNKTSSLPKTGFFSPLASTKYIILLLKDFILRP
ncbi:hypothetical protein CMUS01_13504 [Colletotrichum musicola]|uniref:Uncharacterized protein n=1 Tax=Colletotrichum musicola TaxID=2175873 RepID=A0A8H6JC56_9PEZI|nr:hypothetical protein CMUS01_13504 [Colletotrichum musicola]